jgi:hypothetical protein
MYDVLPTPRLRSALFGLGLKSVGEAKFVTASYRIAALRLGIIYAALLAGTTFLFIAISSTTIDGYPMPSIVSQSISNFIIFVTPTLVSAYYLYAARNLFWLPELYGIFILYWNFEIWKNYKNNEFKCIYWHQGDILCGTFDDLILQLIFVAFVFAFLSAIVIISRAIKGRPVNQTRLAASAILTVVLTFAFFLIEMA